MTEATSQRHPPGEGDAARVVEVRKAAARHASKHNRNPFVRSAAGGRVLSALMLPFVTILHGSPARDCNGRWRVGSRCR
jgi:hypothetical protein